MLAALVGGVLGVGTFIAGQVSTAGKERRSGQAAVSVVVKELQANRTAMRNALLIPPPGTTPRPERLQVSIFPELRVQLAERLDYQLLAKTFNLYDRLTALLPKELRAEVDRLQLERLSNDTETLERELAPHGRGGGSAR